MKGTKRRYNQGFSLLELVIVAGIMAILAVISVNLFFSTLLGGGKSTALNDVKANGDYAITQMERMIREAIQLDPNLDGDTCINDMASITLLNQDNGVTTFSSVDGRIASNSGFLTTGDLNLTLVSPISFNCIRSNSGSPDIVNISFRLRKGNPSADRASDVVEVDFNTTVQLRNY